MHTFLTCLLFAAVMLGVASAETPEFTKPALLATEVELAAPFDTNAVLYADTQGKLWTQAIGQPRLAWQHNWSALADGWDRVGRIVVLKVSPDGQWVCFAQEVGANIARITGGKPVDAWLQGQEEAWAVAVVLARADGTAARAVGLSIEVGGGPDFDFTMDSQRLFGQPFEPCLPDAPHYVEYASVIWEVPPIEYFNYVEVPTGDRGWLEELPISDGYWKCPYSDNFRAENNWYDVHEFSTFAGGGIIGQYNCPLPEGYGMMHGWVLQDAVLLSQADGQGLLYVDGQYKPAPHAVCEMYCWLPDGTYIYSDNDGAALNYGKVDWGSFTVDWHLPLPGLELLSYAWWQPLADSSGVIILDREAEALWHLPLSRERSKP